MECGRLHVGDRVRKIDGHRVEGLSLDRVKSLVLGEEGSAMEIVVTDQQVRIHSVHSFDLPLYPRDLFYFSRTAPAATPSFVA
jgi:hypothetical protein